jgi:peptide deformylase
MTDRGTKFMALLPIVLYPDRGLLQPTEPVERFDDALRDLIRDMAETMYAAPGIGLAANQVGVSRRLFIVDLSAGEKPDQLLVFVNPRITQVDGRQLGEEGCLSFPDIMLDVERAKRATIEAQDADGNPFTLETEDLLARACLYENEHLEGQVFLRNLSSLKRELVKREIRKRIKAGDWVASTAP